MDVLDSPLGCSWRPPTSRRISLGPEARYPVVFLAILGVLSSDAPHQRISCGEIKKYFITRNEKKCFLNQAINIFGSHKLSINF